MKIALKTYNQVSGELLSTSQMIMFHFISSIDQTTFEDKLNKHFHLSQSTKETSVMALISQIEMFRNGIVFRKNTDQTVGDMLKPFYYTLKPFLQVQERGAEFLIHEIDDEDESYLDELKEALWSIIKQ